MAIDLETVTDPQEMRRVWRIVRSQERKVHLTEISLVRDSTGGAAFDLNVSDILFNLKRRISDGTYRPRPPIVVESAKSRLLRRRLSYLSFEDSIILNALVHAARPSLLEGSYDWVNFGRLDKQQKRSRDRDNIIIDYEHWWDKFLRQRKLVQLIEGDVNPLLVISDITNFFGSIDLALLRNKFDSVQPLDAKSTNLLFFLLENLRPRDDYSPQGLLGVPVVQDDASRILAHFYLSDLDGELFPEGQEERYTRWVDDIVVSVPNEVAAGMVMARIERTLARLGLLPNSSKTGIVTKDEFRKEHHEEHNELLDLVHKSTGNEIPPTDDTKLEFEEMLSHFLNSERSGKWNRILKRYYTESRRIRSDTLLSEWVEHLAQYPEDARNILDYVAFFIGSRQFAEECFCFLNEHGSLFDDVQILLYECLLLKPFPNDQELCSFIADQTLLHYRGRDGFDSPGGYTRALQALVMYKFAPSRAAEYIKPGFAETTIEYPLFATYGLPVLAADDKHRKNAFEGIEEIEDSRILRVRALIERLEEGDMRTADILIGLLEPKKTNFPKRRVVNARVLPLLKIAIRSENENGSRLINKAMRRANEVVVTQSDENLIDYVALGHIDNLMDDVQSEKSEKGC